MKALGGSYGYISSVYEGSFIVQVYDNAIYNSVDATNVIEASDRGHFRD